MNYGTLLLSKIIENNATHMLSKLRVDASHFATESERKAYHFIKSYAEYNNGNAPSPVLLASDVDFDYIPSVSDSYEYLSRQLKDYSSKQRMVNLIENEAGDKFDTLSGLEFVTWLKDKAENILHENTIVEKFGSDLVFEKNKFLEEYNKRKRGESNFLYKSRFKSINDATGGYTAGSLVTFFGRSGKGKSVMSIEEIVEMAMNGYHTLVWSLEMGWYELYARIYSSVSARLGLFDITHNNQSYSAGFSQRSLNLGQLDPQFEEAFHLFLENINEHIPGSITLRAVDDEDFRSRDCNQLEADIMAVRERYGACHAVLIDPIYLMTFEKTRSHVPGAEITATSQRLRQIAGRFNVLMFIVTQAEEDKTIESSDGKQKEIRIPTRASLKKSKAILEDSSIVIGMDSLDGLARFGISKSRGGGAETVAELLFLPGYGLVRELTADELDYQQFEDNF